MNWQTIKGYKGQTTCLVFFKCSPLPHSSPLTVKVFNFKAKHFRVTRQLPQLEPHSQQFLLHSMSETMWLFFKSAKSSTNLIQFALPRKRDYLGVA